jgi:hypothetical protein
MQIQPYLMFDGRYKFGVSWMIVAHPKEVSHA